MAQAPSHSPFTHIVVTRPLVTMPRNPDLSVSIAKQTTNGNESAQSPRSPASSYAASTSPQNFVFQNGSASPVVGEVKSPTLASMAEQPQSPASPSPGHERSQSKPFFTLPKASKSSSRLPVVDNTIRQVSEERPPEPPKHGVYLRGRGSGSTPELVSSGNKPDQSASRR